MPTGSRWSISTTVTGQVHGYTKQAAFGYTGVRGLNLQLATISTPIVAPVIAQARLRKGNTDSATSAGRLLAVTMTYKFHEVVDLA